MPTLQGDPYNLQGSNPSLQGGAVATVLQPSASPVAGPTAPPSPTDLSGRYGLVGSTVYRKSDNYAFSNQNDFFRDAGVNSWNGLKLDTGYNPTSYRPVSA